MERLNFFNFIEEKLSFLATRIELRGRLNILDLNLHSEDFYQNFLNLLFDWNLININAQNQNAAGIDLVDEVHKLIVQVSATATKQKIDSALAKDLTKYKGYTFKFISISKDVKNLRKKAFSNPHNLSFSPATDILDIPSLLAYIRTKDIDQQENICDFIRRELKSQSNPEKVESNLTTIIKILSKENWDTGTSSIETVPYDIEIKISYNQLGSAKVLIDDYKIHYFRIDKIYTDFDRQGVNKSLSVLNGIRENYLSQSLIDSPDVIFFSIIDTVVQKIRASANYTSIPDEELRLCAGILVVDAFIRCKIFKNPIGDTDARS